MQPMFNVRPEEAEQAWNALSESQRVAAWEAAARRAPTPDPAIALVVARYGMSKARERGLRAALTPQLISLAILVVSVGLLSLFGSNLFAPLGFVAILVYNVWYYLRGRRQRQPYTALTRSALAALRAARDAASDT